MSTAFTVKKTIHTLHDIPVKKKRYDFPDAISSGSSCSNQALNSLVDPVWEKIDPTPDIHALFIQYNDAFFSGKLSACELKWSPRMTSCAGVCSYEGRGCLCSIRLSKPLLIFRPRKDLVETLLHEMIHAYLFITDRDRDRDGHGPKFQYHMHRINALAGTNITIRHNFIDEVKFYQQHWWRCTGVCRNRPPFYGWVKRSMNRAPSKNDYWFENHQKTCGGIFVKVKEPEGFGEKRKSGPTQVAEGGAQTQQTSLDSFFPGKGYVLGRSSSFSGAAGFSTEGSISNAEVKAEVGIEQLPGSSRDAKVPQEIPRTKKKMQGSSPPSGSRKTPSYGNGKCSAFVSSKSKGVKGRREISVPESGDVLTVTSSPSTSSAVTDSDISVLVPCPVCNEYVRENTINDHLDLCLWQRSGN